MALTLAMTGMSVRVTLTGSPPPEVEASDFQ